MVVDFLTAEALTLHGLIKFSKKKYECYSNCIQDQNLDFVKQIIMPHIVFTHKHHLKHGESDMPMYGYLCGDSGELAQIPAWNFYNTVVKTGLKASSGRPSDRVLQQRERPPQSQFGGNIG